MDWDPLVLIADDDPIGRRTLVALLSGQGYKLDTACNGWEVLEQAAALVPDLILLDVMMPGMDGFEVCQQLRSHPVLAQVPIIMVTALDDRDSRVRGIQSGADDFVTKPVDEIELRARVQTIIRLNRYRRLLQERTRRQEAESEIFHLYKELQEHSERLEETVAQRTLELQKERDRTQAILEALGESVIVTDTEGIIQYVNPATTTLTGSSRTELLGQSWQMWQEDNQLPDLAQLEETTTATQMWCGEASIRRQDGTSYDVMLTVAPLFDFVKDRTDEQLGKISGRLSGFVCVQRDITLLKETERLKDQFVSNVSHELGTPLSVLTLIADNLVTLHHRLDDKKRQKMIQDIQKHAQVLNALIEDILQISRLDSGRISTDREPVNLARVVCEEVDRQSPLAKQKNQTLCVTGIERLTVLGNENQLRLVVRNLINNAIKYTPNGGQVTCECFIGAMVTEKKDGVISLRETAGSKDWAGWRVTDKGIGISPEDQQYLFERFSRIKTQSNVRGTGLGLSIAKELVELYDGHITVSSTLGKGTVFTVYLPLMEEYADKKQSNHIGS